MVRTKAGKVADTSASTSQAGMNSIRKENKKSNHSAKQKKASDKRTANSVGLQRALAQAYGLIPETANPEARDAVDRRSEIQYDEDEDSEESLELEEEEEEDPDILKKFPKGKIPEEVLGATVINEKMVYLIKWKPSEELGCADCADSDEIDGDLIQSTVFRDAYPQLVINFYEKNIVFMNDQRTEDEEMSDVIDQILRKAKMKKDLTAWQHLQARVLKKAHPRKWKEYDYDNPETSSDSDESLVIDHREGEDSDYD